MVPKINLTQKVPTQQSLKKQDGQKGTFVEKSKHQKAKAMEDLCSSSKVKA